MVLTIMGCFTGPLQPQSLSSGLMTSLTFLRNDIVFEREEDALGIVSLSYRSFSRITEVTASAAFTMTYVVACVEWVAVAALSYLAMNIIRLGQIHNLFEEDRVQPIIDRLTKWTESANFVQTWAIDSIVLQLHQAAYLAASEPEARELHRLLTRGESSSGQAVAETDRSIFNSDAVEVFRAPVGSDAEPQAPFEVLYPAHTPFLPADVPPYLNHLRQQEALSAAERAREEEPAERGEAAREEEPAERGEAAVASRAPSSASSRGAETSRSDGYDSDSGSDGADRALGAPCFAHASASAAASRQPLGTAAAFAPDPTPAGASLFGDGFEGSAPGTGGVPEGTLPRASVVGDGWGFTGEQRDGVPPAAVGFDERARARDMFARSYEDAGIGRRSRPEEGVTFPDPAAGAAPRAWPARVEGDPDPRRARTSALSGPGGASHPHWGSLSPVPSADDSRAPGLQPVGLEEGSQSRRGARLPLDEFAGSAAAPGAAQLGQFFPNVHAAPFEIREGGPGSGPDEEGPGEEGSGSD